MTLCGAAVLTSDSFLLIVGKPSLQRCRLTGHLEHTRLQSMSLRLHGASYPSAVHITKGRAIWPYQEHPLHAKMESQQADEVEKAHRGQGLSCHTGLPSAL